MQYELEFSYGAAQLFLPDEWCGDLVYLIGHMDSAGDIFAALSGTGAALAAVSCVDWNRDLSPWPAQAVYRGGENFAGGAARYLAALTGELVPKLAALLPQPPVRRLIAGYSLAGLFALWAAYQTDTFGLVVCASGSTWYDGWIEYIHAHRPLSPDARFYLSVGDKERRTRSTRMSRVEDTARQTRDILLKDGFGAVFEMNQGNHFNDPQGRLIKGIRAVLQH